MRAFIAVTPPEAVRAAIASLTRELDTAQADVRWVPPSQLHFTLKFLPEISDDACRLLIASLERLAPSHAPCAVRLGPLGAFPTLRAPRVLWLGVTEGGEALAAIARAIERQAAALALPAETRPFAPHLTIGRVRSLTGFGALRARLATVAWQPPDAWSVRSVTLYQSVLGSGGARHTALAEIPLGSASRGAAR